MLTFIFLFAGLVVVGGLALLVILNKNRKGGPGVQAVPPVKSGNPRGDTRAVDTKD